HPSDDDCRFRRRVLRYLHESLRPSMGGMKRVSRRGRTIFALGTVLVWMLLAWCPSVLALDPKLDISQYAHTSWRIREGFTKGNINSIVQTPDGYLWLGTEFGLLRFDGVRTIPWQPPPNQHLPSSQIGKLLVARDGTLWIGTRNGLASWQDGKLTEYPELTGQIIISLLEDHEGTVWAGGLGASIGKLCAIHNGSVRCYGEDGALGYGVTALFSDSKGTLWAGVKDGLWRWKPGPQKFYPLTGDQYSINDFAEGDDGTLLIGTHTGIQQLIDGKYQPYQLPGNVQPFQVYRLFRDRDGSLWIGTFDRGLIHIHQGRTDLFTLSDGLSDDGVRTLFEDRENNLWVATINGLDRFHNLAISTISAKQGFSIIPGASVLAARDGSVWFATNDGLTRWNNRQITVYGKSSAPSQTAREIINSGLPTQGLGCLFQDLRGRIWVTMLSVLGYLENDRFIPINALRGGVGGAIAEDAVGNLWIAKQDLDLFHLYNDSVVEQIPLSELKPNDLITALAVDPLQGGLWIGFLQGDVVYFADGKIRASYTAAQGLGNGRVNDFRIEPDGTLWVATDGGLSRLKNGRIATLACKDGLPCDAVQWVIEDDDHSFWLKMACGLVRIARTELDNWATAVEKDQHSKQTIELTIFDNSDGISSFINASGMNPHVAKSSDG